ncbi:MAG: hypothetical protein ACKO1N_01070 [Erythrobacter sp.]
MKQPDKTMAPTFGATLVGFKKRYDFGLSYRKIFSYGLHEVIFISHRNDPAVVRHYGYHEVQVLLGAGNDAINELFDALDAREKLRPKDRTGPSYTFGDGSPGSTVYRMVVGRHPFDQDRDRIYEIRFDHLEADTHACHARFKTMMLQDGFSWFERYADPANISRDVNDAMIREGGHGTDHLPGGPSAGRAELGVAAACVAEPHRVPDLYEQWSEWQRHDDAYALVRGRPRPFEPDMRRRLDTIIDEARLRGYSV